MQPDRPGNTFEAGSKDAAEVVSPGDAPDDDGGRPEAVCPAALDFAASAILWNALPRDSVGVSGSSTDSFKLEACDVLSDVSLPS